MNLYTEEKFEDEEDVRERSRSLMGHSDQGHQLSGSDSEAVLHNLILIAKQHGDLYQTTLDIFKYCEEILRRDVDV